MQIHVVSFTKTHETKGHVKDAVELALSLIVAVLSFEPAFDRG